MKIEQIWSYPVKSMVGEVVASSELTESGIVGDRVWATRDLEHGGIRGAKKLGGLMRFSARTIDAAHRLVEITFPDGSVMRTDNPQLDARLSEVLGNAVTLQQLHDAADLDHYRRGASESDDIIAELRKVFDRTEDEPLPDLGIFPPEVMEFESPPGTYHDCWPLMVMSTSALRALQEAVPNANADVKRFRPSIVVNTGDAIGHPEFLWKGKRATLGTAEIEFLDPCPRCVMVTRQINNEIGEDRSLLRHIVRDLNQNVGVYARVVVPGKLSIGDELSFKTHHLA